eukprot:TRINITY_DN2121_c0_g1_i5.p1 TRINITY_DN2121_c0_g1~~TRINITY_DN2121_c0_g1_i5.p1  ORF type:complete len:116 (-),score=25.03 TRINITY_DN2121_c0_g1_i5:802-1149(-)
MEWGVVDQIEVVKTEKGPFNIVLAADVVYGENLDVFDALIATLERVVDENTIALLCYRPRFPRTEAHFFKRLKMPSSKLRIQKMARELLDEEFQSSTYDVYHITRANFKDDENKS